MKKLITNNKLSEIHIDDIDGNSIIKAVLKGKTFGIIFFNEDKNRWEFYNDIYDLQDKSLSDLVNFSEIIDCEFYVLD